MDYENVDDIDGIFDEYEQIIEGRDENNENADTGAHHNADAESADIVPIRKKRVVRNPRLKFDADRLCGERGLPVLLDHFKGVKFKGKGHEAEDLNRLLSILEHWTHRLFPSMRFEDCLLQIEKLGKKRPVQTCLQKIRMDMPILARDFVGEDDNSGINNDNVFPNLDAPMESAFDQLLNDRSESQHVMDSANSCSPDITELASTSHADANPGPSSAGLTEEQKQRMERNRQIAAEKRKARLAAMSMPEEVPCCSKVIPEPPAESAAEPLEPEGDDDEMSEMLSNVNVGYDGDDDYVQKQPKKRLRIDSSSSDEALCIDELVEHSLYEENCDTNKRDDSVES